MRNAPATFQRMMHKKLLDVNDIVVFSDNWTDHVKTLEKVFKCLTAPSLTINLAKCEFAKGVVTYLSKQVGQGVVKPVEAKISAILEFPVKSKN